MHRLKLKYLLALIFGLSLMAPYFTNLICFKQVQMAHKKTVKKRFNASLKLDEFEKLTFSQSEFKELTWDGEDEFYLEKKKYDLYKVEQKGDSIIAWAWWDHKESHLEKRFHQMLHQDQNHPLKDQPAISLDKLSKYLASLTPNNKYFASADDYSHDLLPQKVPNPYIGLESPPPLNFK